MRHGGSQTGESTTEIHMPDHRRVALRGKMSVAKTSHEGTLSRIHKALTASHHGAGAGCWRGRFVAMTLLTNSVPFGASRTNCADS